MARYTGPACKPQTRRYKKLFLKGDRASKNCATREAPPRLPDSTGQHARRLRATEFSCARSKKPRGPTGFEKQFHHYYELAEKLRGETGENMLVLIERRLDNIVYRMGIGTSRAQARQLVNHATISPLTAR